MKEAKMSSTELAKLSSLSPTSTLDKVTPQEISVKVAEAVTNIERCAGSFQIFTRAHSDDQWHKFVINQDSDTRNLSQLSAEIKAKRAALIEAEGNHYEARAEAELEDARAAACDEFVRLNPLSNEAGIKAKEAQLYRVKAERLRIRSRTLAEPILGCTRDIAKLTNLYVQYEAKILAKHGRLDEEVFEQEERRYWVKRMFRQALYDVRNLGQIGKGEQMSLDGMGFDCVVVAALLRSYIMQRQADLQKMTGEQIEAEITDAHLEAFLEKCADDYADVHAKGLARRGLDAKILTTHLHLAPGAADDSRVQA